MTTVRTPFPLVVVVLSTLCSPAQATTPTPTCGPIAGLTDCQSDSDCVVVDQIGCCPCSMGGDQAAINHDKQQDLTVQLAVCCAAAGVCLDVYQCEDNLGAVCEGGKCGLVPLTATPTPTPTSTPPTGPPGACIGDCDGDRAVTIDELILGVNIALGNANVSACTSLECNQNVESVFVNCLLIAVNNALYGCPQATQTPTTTNTPTPTLELPRRHTCCECTNVACTDFAWVEVEPVCPQGCQTFMGAECEAPCHGGPQSGPATCVSLAPCTSDADCDDGNGCTMDRCTLDGCTHECVCV